MKDFKLNQAIENWRKQLFSYEGMEPEFIDELEENLRDRIDDYLIEGIGEEEAFEKACEKVFPTKENSFNELSSIVHTKSNLYQMMQRLAPNFLKVAFRYFGKRKLFTSINYLSLVCSLVVVALTFLFIQYETSFDGFHQNADRVYRLSFILRSQEYSMLSFPNFFSSDEKEQKAQIEALKNIDGIDDACQFMEISSPILVKKGNKELAITNLIKTNSPEGFFNLFTWNFVLGSADLSSQKPKTIVFSETEIENLYGSNWKQEKVLGQLVIIDSVFYEISGVVENPPQNAHFQFSGLVHANKIDYWGARNYILLDENTAANQAEISINKNVDKVNVEYAKNELFGGIKLQNIQDIHLNSNKLYEINQPGDERYLYILGIVAIIILLITVSNYTNLTIAMNAGRTREIAMRKVFGAGKSGIVTQFFLESIVLALLSMPLALFILQLAIEPFNNFMGTFILSETVYKIEFLGAILLFALMIGLLAGIYPALYLSKLKIQELFKENSIKSNLKGFTARKAIIAFQFFLLIGLISFTIYVNQQLSYVQSKDLGFRSEKILYVNLSTTGSKYDLFKSRLMKNPNIEQIGWGSAFGGETFNQTTYKLNETDLVFDDAYNFYLDYNSFSILELNSSLTKSIEQGEELPNKVRLINRTAATNLMNQNRISETELLNRSIIEEPEYTNPENGQVGFPFEIDGVFEDVNVFSLKEEMKPYFLEVFKSSDYVELAIIAYSHSNREDLIKEVKAAYDELNTGNGFSYSFIEDNISELYEDDFKIGKLTIYMSCIAFLLALVGLVALTSFLTTIRRKEIAVRKIIGASTLQIIRLFNREYIVLLLLATLIAIPITYLGVSNWLSGFAYRIDINPLVFILAFLLTLIVSILVTSTITFKVANSNLVNALKDD